MDIAAKLDLLSLKENPMPIHQAKRNYEEGRQFFNESLWEIDLAGLSASRAFVYHTLRVAYLAGKDFIEDLCPLRASALSYTTLLSLVPLLAFMFAIAKGFGAQDQLGPWLLEKVRTSSVPEMLTVTQQILTFVNRYLEETRTGALGTFALLFLLYTILRTLGTIETSFNEIWGIQSPRTFLRKFSDYLSILAVGPILVITAIGITTSLSSSRVVQHLYQIGLFSTALELLVYFLPYFTLWVAFTLLYLFIPNTRVRFSSALTGGIVGGTLWQFTFWAYVHLQIGISGYNAIYASFASIPIFLIWLYTSWILVLIGAEISFAHQNVETHRMERRTFSVSHASRELIALRFMTSICRRFAEGAPPLSAEELSHSLTVPVHLAREVLSQLSSIQILIEIPGKRTTYQPARPPEKITAMEVFQVLRHYGSALQLKEDQGTHQLRALLDGAMRGASSFLQNANLRDLAASLEGENIGANATQDLV